MDLGTVENARKRYEECTARLQASRKAKAGAAEKINTEKWKIKALEDKLPGVAAGFMMGDIDRAVLDDHLADIERHKQELVVSELALDGLTAMEPEALEASRQAQAQIKKVEGWTRYQGLKAQLLEKFDPGKLAAALKALEPLGHSGSHWRDYEELRTELKRRNPRTEIPL